MNLQELKKVYREAVTFSEVMDKYTAYKRPDPVTSLMFSIGELGEAIQALAYTRGKYLASRQQDAVIDELCDALYMAFMAVDDKGKIGRYDEAMEYGISCMGLDSALCKSMKTLTGVWENNSNSVYFIKGGDLHYSLGLIGGCVSVERMRERMVYRQAKVVGKMVNNIISKTGNILHKSAPILVCDNHLLASFDKGCDCHEDQNSYMSFLEISERIEREACPWVM